MPGGLVFFKGGRKAGRLNLARLGLALGVLVAFAGRLFDFQHPGQDLLLAEQGLLGQALVYEVGFGLLHQLFEVALAAVAGFALAVFAAGLAGFAGLAAGLGAVLDRKSVV